MSWNPGKQDAYSQSLIDHANRELKEQGGARKTDFGEPFRASPAFDNWCTKRYGLDHPDQGQRDANFVKFKRSSDYRRMQTYVNRFI